MPETTFEPGTVIKHRDGSQWERGKEPNQWTYTSTDGHSLRSACDDSALRHALDTQPDTYTLVLPVHLLPWPVGTRVVSANYNTGNAWVKHADRWLFESSTGATGASIHDEDGLRRYVKAGTFRVAHLPVAEPEPETVVPDPLPVGAVVKSPHGNTWTKESGGWVWRSANGLNTWAAYHTEDQLRSKLKHPGYTLTVPEPKPGKRIRFGDLVRYKGKKYRVAYGSSATRLLLVSNKRKHRYVDPAEVEFVRRRLNTEIGEARYEA